MTSTVIVVPKKETYRVLPAPLLGESVVKEPAIEALQAVAAKIGLSEDSSRFLEALRTPEPYRSMGLVA